LKKGKDTQGRRYKEIKKQERKNKGKLYKKEIKEGKK
jgi:hypothetical protein